MFRIAEPRGKVPRAEYDDREPVLRVRLVPLHRGIPSGFAVRSADHAVLRVTEVH